MVYHIEFNIAAAIFLTVFYFFIRIQFTSDIIKNRVFRCLVLSVLLADILDFVTAITISYSDSIPVWTNYVLNELYYLSAAACSLMFCTYVRYLLREDGRREKIDYVDIGLFAIYSLLVLSNPATHLLFYFDKNNAYMHGPFYVGLYAVSFIYLTIGLVRTVIGKKVLSNKQFYTMLLFTVVAIVGTIIQFLLSGYLLVFFSVSVAAFILIFTLETSDYRELQVTLLNLEKANEAAVEAEKIAENARIEAENAKDEAIRANKAKSAFLANMSHEIRTPINGILGMNEIALNENKDSNVAECLENIHDAGAKLLEIINDILDFSKIESGKFEIVEEEYSISSMVYSAKNLTEAKALDKGLIFKVDNNPMMPSRLYGDDKRIEQVMVNLLNNAVKYTHHGRVRMSLDFVADENLPDDMGFLIIKVKDTGIGISKEDQARIFENFARVNLTENKNIEGTGLGLRISKQLCNLMNGDIEMKSALGEGSEFTARIPQRIIDAKPMGNLGDSRPKSAREASPLMTGAFKAPDARILVVDDVQMNLKVVQGLLKKTEIQVKTALSGKECIELVSQEKYDIIFLDHMMPEMDGIETLAYMEMVADSKNLDTPVVILTANAVQGAKDEYLEKGFDDYLSKPINNKELMEMLIKYLGDKVISA